MELVLRFDYGHVVPWVRRDRDGGLTAVAGPDAVHLIPGRPTRGRDSPRSRRSAWTRATRCRSCSPGSRRTSRRPLAVDGLSATEDTTAWWREWSAGSTADGPDRDLVQRSLITLKALTYAPDGRDRGRAHHLAPRGDRRRAQLGLPLLLGPRRHAHPAGADQRRLPRGGGRLARLAAARGRRLAARAADHVRAGGRAAAHRARARLARRATRARAPVRIGNAALDAVPARRLRGADGRAARRRATPACTPTPRPGGSRRRSSATSRRSGASPTRASGRSAAPAATSSTPRSWPGSPSTARCRRWSVTATTGPSTAGASCATQIHAEVCEQGFDAGAQHLHPVLRLGDARRRDADDPARRLPAGGRSRASSARSRRSSASWCATATCSATTPRRPTTACRPARARSCPCSLLARRLPLPDRPPRRGARAVRPPGGRWSTTSGCSRRSTTRAPAARSATSRRPSPTWAWSTPP